MSYYRCHTCGKGFESKRVDTRCPACTVLLAGTGDGNFDPTAMRESRLYGRHELVGVKTHSDYKGMSGHDGIRDAE